ncbi:MAG: hypothetical protein HY814_06695 [Candidatus Riflebacteria bacterium]|nr:hypothetical protein [Candidatus Riflebacteria bacterium]
MRYALYFALVAMMATTVAFSQEEAPKTEEPAAPAAAASTESTTSTTATTDATAPAN